MCAVAITTCQRAQADPPLLLRNLQWCATRMALGRSAANRALHVSMPTALAPVFKRAATAGVSGQSLPAREITCGSAIQGPRLTLRFLVLCSADVQTIMVNSVAKQICCSVGETGYAKPDGSLACCAQGEQWEWERWARMETWTLAWQEQLLQPFASQCKMEPPTHPLPTPPTPQGKPAAALAARLLVTSAGITNPAA